MSRRPVGWPHLAAATAVLALLLTLLTPTVAQDATGAAGGAGHGVNVYYFWGDGCPVCVQQRTFLDQLERRYPEVTVQAFEVWYDRDNLALLEAFADAFGRPVTGVPVTFIGEDSWVGFNQVAGQQMSASVEAYRTYAAPDAADRLHPTMREELLAADAPPPPPRPSGNAVIEIPLVGMIDLSHQPLLVATLLIAFVDGFNPCSLWVLALLLGVVLNTRSRAKVLLVGFTFLIITATVYGLFIAGIFSVFSYVAYLDWIRVVVAILALGFAAVNIKDYFAYKQGISFTISDEHKPGIYARMRNVMQARGSIPATMAATAGLALGVTLVELPCTAGLPVLWSTLLTGAGVATMTTTFVMLLAVYILVYLALELLIFGGVVVTMKIGRFEEREGRILKLIGGSVMLALAVAMLWLPHVLESIGGMLALFGAALGGSALVVLVHRFVHPPSSPLTKSRAPTRAVPIAAKARHPKGPR